LSELLKLSKTLWLEAQCAQNLALENDLEEVHSHIKELARVWDAKTHQANNIVPPPDQGNPTHHT
jgi:hypothetical protein